MLDDTHAWNPTTKTVDVVAAPTVPRYLQTFDFLNAFTPAELAAIRASSNTTVQKFLFMLQCCPVLNMTNANITTAVNGLVSLGLLTAPRAAVVLAAVAT